MNNYNAVLARNTEYTPKSDCQCQTVAFSHYNNLSAQIGIDPTTGKIVSDSLKEQAIQCFENIKGIVTNINHQMNDIVRITIFVKDIADLDIVDEVYATYFTTYKPARTAVAVANLPQDAKVQIEALVSHGEGTIPNAPQAGDIIKLTNNTPNAPTCNLSSQTVAFSHYNNITAQLPIDPTTGRLVVGGIKEQTTQCLKNIKAILQSIDVPMDDIVRTTIFVKDLADVDAINEVYSTFVPDSSIARTVGYKPARTVVEVVELPMYALVQIEAVVSHGDGTPPQLIEDRHGIVIYANNTSDAPICPMSTQTVAFSHYNHISAQLPIDASTSLIVEGGIKEQTEQCLKNIKTIVESIGHCMEDVVKINIAIKDVNEITNVDEVYATYFASNQPARRVIGVNNLPGKALIQIDAVVSNAEGTPSKN